MQRNFALFTASLIAAKRFIVLALFRFEMKGLQEVSSLFKDFDFVWIPMLQILTSATMRADMFVTSKVD